MTRLYFNSETGPKTDIFSPFSFFFNYPAAAAAMPGLGCSLSARGMEDNYSPVKHYTILVILRRAFLWDELYDITESSESCASVQFKH